jgi:CubicO group peptidase (beta-lactamase class C family)
MTRRRRFVLAAMLAALVGGYLLVERPWSGYGLLAMNSLFSEGKRVENFRHMDAVFPAEEIAAARRPVDFPRRERSLKVGYRYGGERRTLDEYLERADTTGLLVMKDGKVVHERYFQGADAASRFTSWSVAKSFVSTLVGMALADGRIRSLDDPIDRYVPKLVGSAYNGVPIRHVLQMSSGVEFDEDYDDLRSDIRLFFLQVYVIGRDADDLTAGYARHGPSGRQFHYASVDAQALGMLVSEVYDRPFVDVFGERLWRPLGGRSAFWNVDATGGDGEPIAFCCLNARLRDYAKLGQLYMQHGMWKGRRLLPAAWVRQATTPGAPHLEPGQLPDPHSTRGYGLQWWVPKGYDREYYAAGVWGQYIYVSEREGVVIARTAVDPDYRDHGDEAIAVFRAIRDSLR